MNNELKCPTCGYPISPKAPSGQCPHCLLRNALASAPGGMDTPVTAPGDGWLAQDLDKASAVPETPGRYTCISEYARGGMGRVLLVNDAHLNRDVALKELLPGVYGDTAATPTPMRTSAALVSRFLQEARITGQLEHPSIVPVYELGQRDDGSIYYTMKLVRGRTLGKAIAQASTLEERIKLLPHFVDLCQAIAYAHNRRVIHRDLKPANVMVGEFGETVVLDWGLAKIREREDAHASGIEETIRVLRLGDRDAVETAYGQALGTPSYMPPEQARGLLDSVDEHSDIYSLGAILYELITGSAPYTGKSAHDVLCKVLEDHPDPIRKRTPNAPSELIAICDRAMQRDPSKRYASAKEIAEEIERFQSGALVSAHRYSVADRVARFVHRHKAIMAIAAVAVFTIAVISIYHFAQITKANKELIISRDNAEEALASEAEQRKIAEAAQDLAERTNYSSGIIAADANIKNGNIALARKFLLELPLRLRNWEWGYLYKSLDKSTLSLAGHAAAVYRAEYSPSGERVVTASADGLAIIWDANSGDKIATLKGHTDRVYDAQFSPDGHQVVTASADNSARLWDADKGEAILTFAGHIGEVGSAKFDSSGAHILTTSGDGTAKLWDCTSGREIRNFTGHEGKINSAVFSPDEQRIVTASDDQTAKLWNTTTGKLIYTFVGHTNRVRTAVFSPDGRKILTASSDMTAVLWDAQTGKRLRTFIEDGNSSSLSCALFSPDSRIIVTAAMKNDVKTWDANSGSLLKTMDDGSYRVGAPAYIQTAALNSDGHQILTASEDGTAKLWDVNSGEEILRYSGHLAAVNSAVFSPDGNHVLTASDDGTAKLWEAITPLEASVGSLLSQEIQFGDSNEMRKDWKHTGSSLRIVTPIDNNLEQRGEVEKSGVPPIFTPDGNQLLVTFGNDAMLLESQSNTLIRRFAGHTELIWCAAISSDGMKIVTGSSDKTLRVWDIASGNTIATIITGKDDVRSVAFAKNGNRILACHEDGSATLWDATHAKLIKEFPGDKKLWFRAIASPDGNRILTQTAENTYALWNAETGEHLVDLDMRGEAHIAVFSPDGRRIVTDSNEEGAIAELWDAATGGLTSLLHDNNALASAAFSPDDRYLITGCENGLTIIWDAKSLKVLARLEGQTDSIEVIAFTPDVCRVLTVSRDSSAKLWDLDLGRELIALRAYTDYQLDAPTFGMFSPDGDRMVIGTLFDEVRVWDSAPWKPEVWTNDSRRSSLLSTVRGQAPAVEVVRMLASQDEGASILDSLESTASKWLTSGGSDGVRAVPNQGIYFEKAPSIPGLTFRDGDLLTGIDSTQIHSVGELAAAIKRFVEARHADSKHDLTLSLDIVNGYEHRMVRIESEGTADR